MTVMILLFGTVELGWAMTSPPPKTIDNMRIIKINNPDHNKVKIKQVCAYFENNPGEGVCTPIVASGSIYIIDKKFSKMPIQRIALMGETATNQQAVCLLYINTLTPSARYLSDMHGYTAEVHYITGDDMVCSLGPAQ